MDKNQKSNVQKLKASTTKPLKEGTKIANEKNGDETISPNHQHKSLDEKSKNSNKVNSDQEQKSDKEHDDSEHQHDYETPTGDTTGESNSQY